MSFQTLQCKKKTIFLLAGGVPIQLAAAGLKCIGGWGGEVDKQHNARVGIAVIEPISL